MIEVIKQSNVVIFSVAVVGVSFVVWKKRQARKQAN